MHRGPYDPSYDPALDNWEISREAVKMVTTDNVQNYVKVLSELSIIHVPCLAHTLNLAVSKGLEVRAIDTALSCLKQTERAAHFWKASRTKKEETDK